MEEYADSWVCVHLGGFVLTNTIYYRSNLSPILPLHLHFQLTNKLWKGVYYQRWMLCKYPMKRWKSTAEPVAMTIICLLSANTVYYTRDIWFYADLIVWLAGRWFINEIKLESFRQHKCELDSLLFGRFFLMPNRRKSSSEFSSLCTGRIKIFTWTRYQGNVDESMIINRISIGRIHRIALMFSFYF